MRVTLAEIRKKLNENELREKAAIKRDGILSEDYPLYHTMFPTTRHDSTGDGHDHRVFATAMYFLGGLSAAQFQMVGRNVIRFHDHKGCLYVVVRAPLSADIIERLTRSWIEVCSEEMVEVKSEDDAWWKDVWSRRRFEADN